MNDGGAQVGRGRRWLARWWPYLVVVLVAIAANVAHVARYTELSPFDESRHIDYMARIYEDGTVVKLGDKLGETAMRLEACRGVDVAGFTPPPCDRSRLVPEDFRDEGYDNAVNNPPLYYLTTGAVAEAVKATGVSDTILDPARVMSGIWLAAGLALTVFAGRVLGARDVPLVAAAIVFALAPEPLFMGATVNADSASLFAGALVLAVALLWERRRWSVWWLLAVGVIAAAFKMTNLIGVGIVAGWLLTRAYVASRHEEDGVGDEITAGSPEDDGVLEAAGDGAVLTDSEARCRRTTREYLWAAGMVVAGAIGMTVLWIGVAGARATIDALDLPSNAQFYERGFPFRALTARQNVFSLLPPIDGYRPPVLVTAMNATVAYGAELLAAAVLISAVLRFRSRDAVTALVASAAAVLLVAGPGFIVSTWVVNKVIFEPVGRYGLSAVAMIVIGTAATVRGRVGTLVLGLFALLSIGTVLGTLVVG
ncbi:MAG: hypothetical protein FJW95_00470 [Actinobacteria bacterium]|nr:hypothetical protein [Actinomycetota bacterium]